MVGAEGREVVGFRLMLPTQPEAVRYPCESGS